MPSRRTLRAVAVIRRVGCHALVAEALIFYFWQCCTESMPSLQAPHAFAVGKAVELVLQGTCENMAPCAWFSADLLLSLQNPDRTPGGTPAASQAPPPALVRCAGWPRSGTPPR